MRVKEFGGQGYQGSCALHSFFTTLCLPYLNDGQRPEQWPDQKSVFTCLFPNTHPQTRQTTSGNTGICEGERDCTNLLF